MHWKLFFHTLFLFAIGQVLALVVAYELKSLAPMKQVTTYGGVFDIFSFLMFFFAATLFLVILFQFHKGRFVYRAIFIATVFLGLFKLFEMIFPSSLSALVAIVFILGLYIIPTVWAHDLIIVLAAAGIGPLFGLQLRWDVAASLLVILSVYDIVAVFVTKHMIPLAHALLKHQASFALLIPEQLNGFRSPLTSVVPGSGFLILGGGDLIIPMIFSTSVFLTNRQLAWWSVCGMFVGFLLNHLFLVLHRKPIPALPLITLGAFFGIAVGIFFNLILVRV